MSKLVDLTGQRFGRLVVLKDFDKIPFQERKCLCKCDCGKEKVVRRSNLTSGNTKSCGCLGDEIRRKHCEEFTKFPKKHGDSNTRLHNVWSRMRQRCNDPNYNRAKSYFLKGITICKEWDDYIAFKEWALSHGYRDDLSIDRIDNSKGYSPENCRWATAKEQANNRTSNHLLTYDGKTMTIYQWADYLGISRSTLSNRISRGWSVERALTTTVGGVKT